MLVNKRDRLGTVRPNETDSYGVSLLVPPIPPTDEVSSNICKVSYAVRVVGTVARHHKDILLVIPITIGTYPILDNLHITSHPTERNEHGDYVFPIANESMPAQQRPVLSQRLTVQLPPPTIEDHAPRTPAPPYSAISVTPYPEDGKFDHSFIEFQNERLFMKITHRTIIHYTISRSANV